MKIAWNVTLKYSGVQISSRIALIALHNFSTPNRYRKSLLKMDTFCRISIFYYK